MVSVIASSVRKGNVIEKDGKLYVVLKAENIHPGKGTPVTHLEMRRISDGVKMTERYKTTDSMEKAFIDEGPTIISTRTANTTCSWTRYFRPAACRRGRGRRLGALSSENMEVQLSAVQRHGRSRSRCRSARRFEIMDTEPVVKGQTASGSFKPAHAVERRAHHGADPYRARHPRRGDDRGRLLRRAGEGLNGAVCRRNAGGETGRQKITPGRRVPVQHFAGGKDAVHFAQH